MNVKQGFKGLLLIIILWVLFILFGYYFVHKPIDMAQIGNFIPVIIDVIAGLGIVIICGGLGRKFVKADTLTPLERIAIQAALGAVIIGLTWLLLGSLNLYIKWVAWLIFITSALFLRKEITFWCKDFLELGRYWKEAGRFEKWVAVGMGVLVFVQCLYALAPPLKWDALTYHLQLPRQYLDAGKLIFIPNDPYWGHPQLVEMIFTFAYALNRGETAALTNWGFGMIFLVGLLGITRRFSESNSHTSNHMNAGWIAVAAILVGITPRYLMGWAYTDLFASLFGLIGIITFFQWLDTKDHAWLRWSFLFTAAATTVKWTNGVFLLGLLICLPFLWKKNQITLKVLVQISLISLALILPWLLKNMLATGNPIYPYLIPSANFSAERVALANGGFAQVQLWERIFLPFSITFMGVDTAAGFNIDIGPLLLLLGVPGLIVHWGKQKVRYLVLIVIPGGLVVAVLSIWLGHLLQPRLFLVLLGLLAIPAGLGWGYLQDLVILRTRIRRIIGVVILIVLGFSLLQDGLKFINLNPALAMMSPTYKNEYLHKGLGVYQDAVETVNSLPVKEKVLLLWEPRGFYMPLGSQADLWIDRFQTDVMEIGNQDQIMESWCSQGFTRVLVYKKGENRIKPKEGESTITWNLYLKTRQLLGKELQISDWYGLYSLNCQKK